MARQRRQRQDERGLADRAGRLHEGVWQLARVDFDQAHACVDQPWRRYDEGTARTRARSPRWRLRPVRRAAASGAGPGQLRLVGDAERATAVMSPAATAAATVGATP